VVIDLVELAPACSALAVLPVSGLQPRNRPIFFSVAGPVAGLSAWSAKKARKGG